MDARALRSACKKRWEARAKPLRGRRERSRTMDFSNHFKIISELFPGASRKVRRELAVRRVKVGTMAFAAAYDQQNEWEQKAN